MAAYRFLTTWLLEASRELVWDTIYDAARWPEWWRGVEWTEVLGERLWHSRWRSAFPYSVEFEFELLEVDRPNTLEGRARGDLVGQGTWRVYDGKLGTASTWEWDVSTTRLWLNALGAAAKPALAWNHHRIMCWGAEDLARHLGVRLLAASG